MAGLVGSWAASRLRDVGTPGTIADQMEEWLFSEACDGFNLMFPYRPDWTTSSIASCRNCNDEDSFGVNTRAKRLEKIWACRAHKIDSSRLAANSSAPVIITAHREPSRAW
jgi:hypothetical protein